MNTVLRKIGNSEGVILPREVLDKLGLKAGDSLEIVATRDGVQLVKSQTDFAEQMRLAEEFMDKYHDALSKLAK